MLRKRATLIVKTKDGILLGRPWFLWNFSLAGGGVKRGESFLDAGKRELKEETDLSANKIKYLFDFRFRLHRHEVFLVEAHEKMEFNWENRDVVFVNKQSYLDFKMNGFSRKILERYFEDLASTKGF